MSESTSNNASLVGLTYSNSVILPTWTMSKMFTLRTETNFHHRVEKIDKLKELFNGQLPDKCSIHTCLNWLMENKSNTGNFPSDIINDYASKRLSSRYVTKPNSGQHFLQNIITLLKHRIKRKIKPKNPRRLKKRASFLLKLNFNSNKPCCNSALKGAESTKGFKFNYKYTNKDFPRSFTQEMDDNNIDASTTTDMLITNPNEFNDSCLCRKAKEEEDAHPDGKKSKEAQTETVLVPKLVSRAHLKKPEEEELPYNKLPYGYLLPHIERYANKSTIPESYNVCYSFYLYLYPSITDSNLLLFQRHTLKKISRGLKPFDLNQLLSDTNSDFLFDRRVRMVEKHCKCHIVLEPLNNIFLKGLPHRIVKIYSCKYENIARALTIMEDTMPDLMNNSVFTSEFPASIHSRKWSADNVFVRPLRKSRKIDYGCSQWSQRVNQRKKFPNLNFMLESPTKSKTALKLEGQPVKPEKPVEKKDNIVYKKILSSEKTPAVNTPTNKSNIYDETIDTPHAPPQPFENDTKTSTMNIFSNSMSVNNSMKYRYSKRIKCPATVFHKEKFSNDCVHNFLFEKFHCNITKIDEDSCCKEQVKLTILYNSKDDFNEFCKALGLCIKLKEAKITFD